jgi:DnaJ-class molecular chaperone
MAKKKVVKEKEMEECPGCNGSGTQPCGYCGADDMEECIDCGGTGEVEKEDED